jgi:hypothetical protein
MCVLSGLVVVRIRTHTHTNIMRRNKVRRKHTQRHRLRHKHPHRLRKERTDKSDTSQKVFHTHNDADGYRRHEEGLNSK